MISPLTWRDCQPPKSKTWSSTYDLAQRIKRGEKVGLRLTRTERKLLLTGLVFLHKRVEEIPMWLSGIGLVGVSGKCF